MPPVRITKVMPTATMPITTDWSRILKMFDLVRKNGDRNESATAITMASTIIRISRLFERRVKILRGGMGTAATVIVESSLNIAPRGGRPPCFS